MLPGSVHVNLRRISDLIAPIRDRWMAGDARPRNGVSPNVLQSFELKYGVTLLTDFGALYRGLDGMPPNHWDDELIRWWPIAEVKPVNDELKHAHGAYPNQFIFADWSLWAHAYAIDLGPGATRGRVVIVGGDRPIPVAASFTEFLDLYTARSDKLYGVIGNERPRKPR